MTRAIIEYRVATATTSAALTENVTKLIQEGYQPYGSAVIVGKPRLAYALHQPMVKYKEEQS